MDGFLCYKNRDLIFKFVQDEELFADFDYVKFGRRLYTVRYCSQQSKNPTLPFFYEGYCITYIDLNDITLLLLKRERNQNSNISLMFSALQKICESITNGKLKSETFEANRYQNANIRLTNSIQIYEILSEMLQSNVLLQPSTAPQIVFQEDDLVVPTAIGWGISNCNPPSYTNQFAAAATALNTEKMNYL
jgi:hypothetical protein